MIYYNVKVYSRCLVLVARCMIQVNHEDMIEAKQGRMLYSQVYDFSTKFSLFRNSPQTALSLCLFRNSPPSNM